VLLTEKTCRRQTQSAAGPRAFRQPRRHTAARAGNVINGSTGGRHCRDVHHAVQETRLLLLRQ